MHFAIIAAGRGSRLDKGGVEQPKPLVEINGRPMIRRLIDIFIGNNAESISIITNQATGTVSDYLYSIAPELPVALNIIAAETTGSMHSFHRLAPLLPRGKRFILSTVDTIFDPAAFRSYVNDFAADTTVDGYMAVTDYIDDEKPLYISVNSATGLIDGFCDKRVTGCRYISAGIYGLTPKALEVLDQCVAQGLDRMRDYQRALLAAGLRLRPYRLGTVIDIDRPADIDVARRFAEKIIPSPRRQKEG